MPASFGYGDETDIIMAASTNIYNSGILNYLVPLFEKRMPYRIKILSLSNEETIAMGKNGKTDLVFISESDLAEKLIADGFGIRRWEVMHNFSVIIGPLDDPARIKGKDPIEALKAIVKGRFPFISGLDCPDIQMIERRLWSKTGIVPEGSWYMNGGTDMGNLIDIANQRSAYIISDRDAYLARRDKIKLALLLDRHPLLFNQYTLVEISPVKFPWINNAGARAFVDFITSSDGEDIIRRFGMDRYGEQLFYPQ